jgi:quercetin dioxygenase-like cupin family protein
VSDRPRITAHQAGAVVAAFVIGGILAIIVERAIGVSGPMRATDTLVQAPTGTLEAEDLPRAPVRVVAERVRLPAGYESTRSHGGPTFLFIDYGRIQVEGSGSPTSYGAGAFFFVTAGEPYSLRAVETTQIASLSLLPPGAEAKTELGER